ncbi:GMC oxidoreductase [Polyporus arcularius HHB13444]|uniref:GMC oxidoreductase n=1 Tax=Polyporus arcularius HHB13444 TaxID=1314778 RepID=A0A5C3NUK7_9APHY|nr:GMC oxidoreductase [Polyporus arcularius HHB13444]
MGRFNLLGLAVLASLTNLVTAGPAGRRTFDYVVVGGGTAGLVVATRLSEDPDTTVAVIEAGPHHVDEPLVDTPEFFSKALGNPAFDWRFVTTPQANLNNAILPQPRGKMLGGSSGLNFIVWDRASQREYDAWEQLGATGWNWNSLLPYFKKTETVAPQLQADIFPQAMQPPQVNFDDFHGRSGPVQPSYNVIYSNVSVPYVETINNIGVGTNSDPYTGNATGVYNTEVAIDRVKNLGKRSYAASTYFNMSSDRPNLTVFLSSQATKINFDLGDSVVSLLSSLLSSLLGLGQMRASSVDVVALNSTGITGRVFARKEVILSGGAFGTPQLLELSGIGNPEILREAGIPTLIDLPAVGENFQDHPSFTQDFEVQNTLFTYDLLRNNATFNASQTAEYSESGTGLLANVQFVLTFSPLKALISSELLATVQDQATALINAPGTSPLARRQHRITRDFLTADDVGNIEFIMFPGGGRTRVAPTPGSAYITVYTCLMHPFSRGSVHVNTSDPMASPLIDPSYLDNDIDRQLALQGVKLARTITQTEPLNALVVGDHSPGANVTTDADWTEFTKDFLTTTYHPIGTAAMLPRELGGVVDPLTLKVHGTANLRVVDASLMPMLIATHPQSTVYAIAERAADIIRGRILGS